MTANDAGIDLGRGEIIPPGPPMEIVPARKSLLQFGNMAEAMEASEMLANSQFVPASFRGKPGDVFACLQWATELDIPYMQAMRSIAVVNGKPSLYGDLGKALLMRRRGIDLQEFRLWTEPEGDVTDPEQLLGRCIIRRSNPGGAPIVADRVFSVKDAKRAGLWGKQGPWSQYPRRMLEWRAFWLAMRDVYPDLLSGLHAAEEMEDIIKPAEARVIPTQDAEGKVLSQMERAAVEYGGEPIAVDASKGPVTVDLPPAEGREGETVVIRKTDGTDNPVTVKERSDPTDAPASGSTAAGGSASSEPAPIDTLNAPKFTTKNPPKRAKTGDTWQTGGKGPIRVLDESGVWLDVDAPDAADVHDGMGGVWVCQPEPVMAEANALWVPGCDISQTLALLDGDWVEGDDDHKATARAEIVRRCHALSPRPIAPEGFTDHDLAALYLRLAEGSEG